MKTKVDNVGLEHIAFPFSKNTICGISLYMGRWRDPEDLWDTPNHCSACVRAILKLEDILNDESY